MRILYLHQYFLTPEQAGGTRSYEMARRLVARGHEVTVVTAGYGMTQGSQKRRDTMIEGIKVIYLPVSYANEMGILRRILAFAIFALRASWCAVNVPCDVVFATSTPLTVTIPGMLASIIRRVPYVFEVRDMWPDVPIAIGALNNRFAQKLALWMEAITYRQARHIVALAPGMRDEIVAKGVPMSKVTVIPNGCDLELFAKAREANNDDLLAQLPDSARASKRVIFAGTLGMANGVKYLGELANEMAKLSSDVTFIVCGHGRDRDMLERYASETGVLGRTFFMLGSTRKVDVARWMSLCSASIGLFTGPEVLYRNAVQNKFFDSLSAGLPVACNFIGWQSQIALDHNIGVYLDPNDASKGAAALHAALQDRDWLDASRDICLDMATHRFNRDMLADDLNKVLTDAVQ